MIHHYQIITCRGYRIIVIDHYHRGFDVIREQEFDIIKGKNFVFENNTLNEVMLNAKQTKNNKKITYI